MDFGITPLEYEEFVASVCRELMEHGATNVRQGRGFKGRVTGRTIVIDVSFETEVLGAKILVLVECKHYSKNVPVDDVEEFHSKMDDIGAQKGIMITTQGYQSGAVKAAMGRGIALAILPAENSTKELKYIVKTAGLEERRKEVRQILLQGMVLTPDRLRGLGMKEHMEFKGAKDLMDLLALM